MWTRPHLLAALLLAAAPTGAAPPFEPSFIAGTPDPAGQTIGGTEIRNLVAQNGRLFAATGFWKDPANSPGPQILVLDAPGAPWRLDHVFDDRAPNGRHRRHVAISALAAVTLRTDATGARLPAPIALLLASTWDVTGRRTVFARDTAGAWSATVIAQDRPSPPFLPQIRAFAFHRDSQTGADLVFAGDTTGIFAAHVDPAAPGRLAWSAPEFTAAGTGADAFPGLTGRLRVSSFAEAGGRLFAAVGQQVWARQDGPTPSWRLLYTNPSPHYSQTGLRGLTAVTEPGGTPFLLAAVEGNAARIVRIDPLTGAEATDLDLAAFLNAAWSTRVSYVIGAYNDMAPLPGGALLIGLEAFIPPASPRPPGHTVLDVNHGLEGGGWFLIRHPGARYELCRVAASVPGIGENLVAVRTIAASPFPAEPGVFYLGGYDANDTPAHNSAWIVRARPASGC